MRNDPKINPGDRFGRLSVLKEVGIFQGMRYWLCECACGKPALAISSVLKNGGKQSCGCLIKQNGSKGLHKMYNSPEYRAWVNMKRRCLNSNCPTFKDYGGRGITIHSNWISSFKDFLSTVGRRPSNKYSLGRIDNNQGYFPGNVQWQTIQEQKRNTRNNRLITIGTTTKILSDWAKEVKIHPTTISSRIQRGWTPEEALKK